MMDFIKLAKERYSVRKFTDDAVSEKDLALILDAANSAPTASNKQPFRILALQDKDSLQKLKECTNFTFDAPVALVVCCNENEAWVRNYDGENFGMVDATIVGTHIMLAVCGIGLGTTWVGHFRPAEVKRIFSLPEGIVPAAIFPIGHPAADSVPSARHFERKQLSEIVVHEHF